LAAVARRASVMVAGDTGPLHLAAAVGTPCVGLYGPTSAARNGPYGTGHRVLAAPDGKMASIDVPSVLDAVLAVIGRRRFGELPDVAGPHCGPQPPARRICVSPGRPRRGYEKTTVGRARHAQRGG